MVAKKIPKLLNDSISHIKQPQFIPRKRNEKKFTSTY